MNTQKFREDLERLSSAYPRTVEFDPISFPLRFPDPKDREIVSWLSAMYAFGNVKAIFRTLENFLSFLGKHPHQRILSLCKRDLSSYKFAKHRWVTSQDTQHILLLLQSVLREFGSLESSFKKSSSGTLEEKLIDWMSELKSRQTRIQKSSLTRGQLFLFASPKNKSASKRLWMFMRWVVRRNYPDLGLWKTISPSELKIPLDVHLFQFGQNLGLTHRKQANAKAVDDITNHFRKIIPEDPTRYDFVLAQLGIRDLCIHQRDARCLACPIQTHCRHGT